MKTKTETLPLTVFVAALMIFPGASGNVFASEPSFVAFTVGDPGIPGDGISVTLPSNIFFILSTPFSIAPSTDGITITAYPPEGSTFVFDGPEDFVSVIFVEPTTGYSVGTGFAVSGATSFNGIAGVFFNISQEHLEFLSQFLNEVYGTNITVADLAIGGFALGIEFGADFLTTLDAAAIGFQNPALPAVAVSIDVKPGSNPSSISLGSKGVIPVAVLTTDTFDATTVDPITVRFGAAGTEAVPVHSALEDVDGDGDIDLILQFRTEETGILCGDSTVSVTGETFDGQPIEGSDSIRTVRCK